MHSRILLRNIAGLCSVLLLTGLWPTEAASLSTADSGQNTVSATESLLTYGQFLQDHAGASSPDQTVVIRGNAYTASTCGALKREKAPGGSLQAVYTPATGSVTWQANVPQAGLYNMAVTYRPEAGTGTEILREIYINGSTQYEDLISMGFPCSFRDSTENWKIEDGSQLRPQQVEVNAYSELTLTGNTYYAGASIKVYLHAGINTICFDALKEPMTVASLKLYQAQAPASYQQVRGSYPKQAALSASDTVTLQAEKASLKSDATLYPLSDRSSPATSPQSVHNVLLNTIGGTNWENPNQSVTWTIHVKKTGLYRIAFRGRQNYNQDVSVTRKLLLDGKVPFAEAEQIEFPYSTRWQVFVVGGNDTPYEFYLTAGTHTLTLQNAVGSIGPLLEETNNCVTELNQDYREIMMITGTYPDANRNYNLEQSIPDVFKSFRKQMAELQSLERRLLKIGSKGIGYTDYETLREQIGSFLEDSDSIPERLDSFNTNISNLSMWMLSCLKQPLLLDTIQIAGASQPLPVGDAGFLEKAVYEFQSFLASFTDDYENVSTVKEQGKSVTLWLGSVVGQASAGRDQAQIMKDLVEQSFTPKTGIHVDIRLVDLTALLPAVSAGRGPDVTIMNTRDMPMNYAYRGAVMDLSRFSDLQSVLKRFSPQAVVPFRYGGKVYALPDSYTYYMMFYRTDIFEQLGLKLPKTWDDVYALLPELKSNYMEIGFPNLSVDNNMDMFVTLLNQMDGSVYAPSMKKATLDSETAVAAFEKWVNFYTKYNVLQKMDQLTRFRTGEAPLVFMPYTFFNNIEAAAPEIQNHWNFALMPGTKDAATGKVNNTVYGTSTGAVIYSNAKDPQSSWEFLKWWTSEDTQYQYDISIEALQGEAGRWPTSNLAALRRLPWTTKELTNIERQGSLTRGLQEVPGSYVTARYVATAARLCINDGLIPREAILNYNKMINDEIAVKSKEFGLS